MSCLPFSTNRIFASDVLPRLIHSPPCPQCGCVQYDIRSPLLFPDQYFQRAEQFWLDYRTRIICRLCGREFQYARLNIPTRTFDVGQNPQLLEGDL